MHFFPVNWILLFEHLWIFKNSTGYARMAISAVRSLFWALPKSEFGEHASNNNPSLKQFMKKKNKDCIGDFWQQPRSCSVLWCQHSTLSSSTYTQACSWEWESHGEHTFVFPMRPRIRTRVSECYWIVILRLYFWILKSINFVVLHVLCTCSPI